MAGRNSGDLSQVLPGYSMVYSPGINFSRKFSVLVYVIMNINTWWYRGSVVTVSVQRLNREPMFEYLICIIEQDECQCFFFCFFSSELLLFHNLFLYYGHQVGERIRDYFLFCQIKVVLKQFDLWYTRGIHCLFYLQHLKPSTRDFRLFRIWVL